MKRRVSDLVERIKQNRVVRTAQAVMTSAGAVGLPLMAMALAFTTMFAILPGILLLTGVLGWFVSDPVRQAELLAQLVAFVPPLAPLFEESLEGLVRARDALSIVGLLGLIWGASNFYAALDEVMRRFFPGGGERGFISRRIRGVLAVAVLVVLVVGTVALSGVWAYLQTTLEEFGPALSIVMPLVSIVLVTLVVLVVYLFVPTAPPTWGEALPPAIVAGVGIGLLTNLFTVLAPLMVGGLAAFGVVATAFAAFVWLNFCFQLLLFGAAWARYRRDTARLRAEPASRT
jgi:membrane protein